MSLMAYVLPDYDVAVECAVCEREGIAPLYEPSWIGEMFNWGSELPIYNKTKQERLRRAQGLYTQSGEQTELGARAFPDRPAVRKRSTINDSEFGPNLIASQLHIV